MKYLGSKNRHAKDILPIILEGRTTELYVEPFVGGANTLDKVGGERLGADIDADLITLWNAVSAGWLPPENITEGEYNSLKTQTTLSPIRGYAAFALSFGGKKFGGWSRGLNSQGLPRRYDHESYRNAIKQFPLLQGVNFKNCSYLDLNIPDGSIIYCDPPYKGTTQYASAFNHDLFFDWCRDKAKRNTLFVSEYAAPNDFVCVWEKEVPVSIASNRVTSPVKTERLFRCW